METNNKTVKQRKRRDQKNSTNVKEILQEELSCKLIKNTTGGPDEVNGTGDSMNNNISSQKHHNGAVCNRNTLIRDQGDGASEENLIQEKAKDINTVVNKMESIIEKPFTVNFELNVVSLLLFIVGIMTRMWRLQEPMSIVFDELHYGKFASLYMKKIFFFDSHPPLGKQLIALAGYLAGFDANFQFDKIGGVYNENVPVLAFRAVPAFFGSLLIPTVYQIIVELGLNHWTALIANNALLTQSRFILMESMLIFFSVFGILCLIKFRKIQHDVKYIGVLSSFLAVLLLGKDYWQMIADKTKSHGGLASVIKGQPLVIAHGSQVTLRHTHGRACWLHSHPHVYPLRYPDKRGSSHQQQVVEIINHCFIKNSNDLVVSEPLDPIKHGDIVQLVHGITSRALNSHDVAAPMSPQNQEVSCYIDYNISFPAQNLWKVNIVNKDTEGLIWHTIQSQVRLVHINSSQALKFSGKQLPDWGFHQHEVSTDRIINQEDTIWNVEEHRYTKGSDQKERERELGMAEFVPTKPTAFSFFEKLYELQIKMLTANQENVQDHMYSSDPLSWPLMNRGIAYWVSQSSNAQIHLLGNVLIWYWSTFSVALYLCILVIYLLRRRRACFDIPEGKFINLKKTFAELQIFMIFVLSYGTTALSAMDVLNLRWKDTWDLIIHKP
ncbi:Protein O-mannosyltransferase 1 [Nymphon striatum]|nr:Protein O-mannosyltransferase 1 [Nymphon striatum]